MNWKTIDTEKVRNVWKEQTSGKEHTFSPDWHQLNENPMGDDDQEMVFVRTEIVDETPGEIRASIEEYSHIVGGPTGSKRTANISLSQIGLRIQLGNETIGEDNPDLYLEATPDGWRALAHANPNEEPFAVIDINDDGKHEVSFREENIPALA